MRRAGRSSFAHEGGYALVEVALALMLVALLAALALPGFAHGSGPAALRVTAFQVSALLREDRTAAARTGRPVVATLTANGVRSGAGNGSVAMPSRTVLRAPSRILFTPGGQSTGGDIVIASGKARTRVAVNPDTGAIRVEIP